MSIISAGTSSSTAVKVTGNTDGTLVLKTNDTGSGGTTALTLATNQAATFASSVSATTVSASTAVVQGGAAANYAGNFRDATVGGSCYLQITTNASGSANTDGLVWGLDTASPPNGYLSLKENATLYLQANSATVGAFSSTGLAVTGTLSSTGTITVNSPAATNSNTLIAGGTTTGFNRIYFTNTSGELDLGVEGSSGGTFYTGSIAYAGLIGCGVSKPLQFATNNTVRMTLDSSGNLGVGTYAPASKLAVATASNTSDLGATGLTIGGATTLTSGNVLMLNFTPIGADSNRARAGIGCEVGADWGKGNLTFYTRDASNSSAMTTSDERMRIDSNGYVGIGTTSPLQKVQIAAPSSSGNISPALAFSQGGSGSGTGTSLWLGYGAENTKSVAISGFYDGAGMTMAFYTTPTAASTAFSERMRIDSSGVVRTGSATTSGASSGDICLPNNIALRGANTTNLASRKLAYVDTGNFAFYGDTALNGVKLANDTYPSANNAYTLGSDTLRWGDFRTQVGQCYGAFSKGSGTFDIEHPVLEGKRLRHSFVEGPRYDLIYRGRVTLVNGEATVNLDTDAVSDGGQTMTAGTFVALTRDPDVFLQNKSGWTRVKGVVNGATLTITSETSCNDVISWMVIAERCDDNVLESYQCDDQCRLILEYDSSELSKPRFNTVIQD